MFKQKLLIFLSLSSLCFSQEENMNQLLSTYKVEASLGKITKSEAAGFVDVYSREDLEMMQAHTLMDILKQFSIPNISRTSNGLAYFTKPSNMSMPNSAIRLYINDHDMAASTYGSDAVMWADMSLEYIDHIVVYKTSSSVEFGNEPGTVIIKLYTKDAALEQGGKLRTMVDNKGSISLSTYYGETLKNDFSYFVYANGDDIKREKYYNKGHELNSDTKSENFYSNFSYKNWLVEFSHLKKKTNSFLGLGVEHTPSDGGLDANHDYIHVTKEFQDNYKLQLSYDQLDFDGSYVDNNGINVSSLGLIKNYYTHYKDKVFSAILEKTIQTQNNKLLLGGFYKLKTSDVDGLYDGISNSYNNSLNLYSLYAEDSYSINRSTMLVSSLKFDFYRYDKSVQAKNEFIARVGLIKNIDHFQMKVFYTKTYYPIPMAYLYSDNTNIPYKTNEDLDYTEPTLLSLGIRYKNEKHEAYIRYANINVKNKISYSPTEGFINIGDKKYNQYEFKYIYKFDYFNKISFDIATGDNGESSEFSSKYIGHIIAYNRYGKFDFYNELDYKNGYVLYGVAVGDTYNFTSSIKYHITNDLSGGIKAENIFDNSAEQVYKNMNEPIPVFDRKIWINMEYLF